MLIPAPKRDFYFPIDYIIGRNAFSDWGLSFPEGDERFDWIDQCLKNGKVFVTPRHKLVGGTLVVAVFVPVYAPSPNAAAPHKQPRGVAVAIFAINTLVATSLPNSSPSKEAGADSITAVLRDESAAEDNQLLFSNTPKEALISEWHGHWTGTIPVGDRRWLLSLHTKERIGSYIPAAVVFLGILLSAFAAALIWLFSRMRSLREDAQQLGQYELLEKLGEGGMGAVYRAQHSLLRRPTAIKLIHKDLGNEHTQNQFEQEVQAAAELTHPNSITVYDYGNTPDGILYYAMEYIPGINLHDLVMFFGPLNFSRVVYILKQVCGALAEAHARALVHRDVKPANVMLCRRGELFDFVKVLDFGLVLRTDKRSSRSKDKRGGKPAFMGTPHYMAPEQITDSNTVGPEADIYALGCVAFFLLTGETLFEAGHGSATFDAAYFGGCTVAATAQSAKHS